MKNFTLKIIAPLFVIFLTITIPGMTQIHSTSSGGAWNDINTWVELTIPESTDDVVINGPVYCYNGNPQCNNISITSSGSLQNDYYSGSLIVHGDITNSGTLQNYSSTFTIFIGGYVR